MRTELFIKQPLHEPNEILNGSFYQGKSYWNDGLNAVIQNGVCYLLGEEENNRIYQTGIVKEVGNYKLTITIVPPANGDALLGHARINIGSEILIANTIGAQVFNVNVLDIQDGSVGIIGSGIFTGGDPFNGGITNISIESLDGVFNQIDLFDDIAIPITFNIADIIDFTKRNANYSKTIQLPGTELNNKLFKHIYNISTTGRFVLNKPIFAYVLQDSIPVFEGSFELTACNILNDKDISYEGVIYSTNASLFAKIGTKYLTKNENRIDDIDFSEYNQILSYENVFGSLTKEPGSGVIFTPVDKYNKESAATPELALTYRIDEMTPCLFVKEIFDKIFKKAGFTYSSDFLNTEFFKRLIYLHSDYGILLTEEERKAKSFKGTLPNTIITQYATPDDADFTENFNAIWDGENGSLNSYVTDPLSSNYGQFVCQESGYYKIRLFNDFKARLRVKRSDGTPMLPEDWTTWKLRTQFFGAFTARFLIGSKIIVEKVDGSLKVDDYTILTNVTPISQSGPYKQEVDGKLVGVVNMNYDVSDPFTFSADWINHPYNEDTENIKTIFLNKGDKVYNFFTVEMEANNTSEYIPTYIFGDTVNGYFMDAAIELIFDESTLTQYFEVEATNVITEGMSFKPNRILHKVKQADFITSIVKMFNLYIEPTSATNFLIEPREAYYDKTAQVLDWTEKTSVNNIIKIERANDLIEQIVNFKYDYDEDFYSKKYKDAYTLEYGEFYEKEKQNIDNTFKSEYTLIFATLIHGPAYPGSKFEVPKLFTFTEDLEIDITKKYKPRILHWKGLIEVPNTTDQFTLFSDAYIPWINQTFTGPLVDVPGMEFKDIFNYPSYHAFDVYKGSSNNSALAYTDLQLTVPGKRYRVYASQVDYDDNNIGMVIGVGPVTFGGVVPLQKGANKYWTFVGQFLPTYVGFSSINYKKKGDLSIRNLRLYEENEPLAQVAQGLLPFAAHFDELNGNCENDLMFNTNDFYWCSMGQTLNPKAPWPRDKNLIAKYWRNTIDEFVDTDSSLVTLTVFLEPKDIQNLKFYDKILIDGIYYKLNKIIEYLPGELCKVELLKSVKHIATFDLTPPSEFIEPEITTKKVKYIDRVIGGRNVVSQNNQYVLIDKIEGGRYDGTEGVILPIPQQNFFIDKITDSKPQTGNVSIKFIKNGPQ